LGEPSHQKPFAVVTRIWRLGAPLPRAILASIGELLRRIAIPGARHPFSFQNHGRKDTPRARSQRFNRTLDQYIYIAREEGGGLLNRDLGYKETKIVHADTLELNNLSLNNWTLNIPMELIRQKYGDEVVERLWVQIRDTGGDGPGAALISAALTVFTTTEAAFSENEAAR
jgi:hypothetical protein